MSPTVHTDKVFIGSSETIFALSVEDGTKDWEFKHDLKTGLDPLEVSPTCWEEFVYISSEDALYALNINDGTVQWKNKLEYPGEPIDVINCTPTVVDDPQNGRSLDSRIMLGTLNHHDSWANQ
jgi:outer membrane protein assembly factor BamB